MNLGRNFTMGWFLKLRFLLPALSMLILVLSTLLAYTASRNDARLRTYNNLQRQVNDRLNAIQGNARQYMRLELGANLNQLVASFASEADLLALMIVDAEGTVLASSQYSDVSRHWRELELDFDRERIARLTDGGGTQLNVDKARGWLDGYASVCHRESDSVLRPARCGFVFYRVDMNYHYRVTDRALRQQASYFAIGMAAMAIAMLLLLHIAVGRRAVRIVKALKAFNGGDRGARIATGGEDEIAWVATTINEVLAVFERGERVILDNQERLRAVIETAPDAVITINEIGIIETVNPAVRDLFGYADEEMIGHNVSMLMPEPQRGEHDGYIESYLTTGAKKVIGKRREVYGLTRDGHRLAMALSVGEMAIGGKRFFTGILRDISDRVNKEERLRAVINTALDAIITIDSHGIIETVNPAALNLFGYEERDVIGNNVSMLMPDPHRSDHDEYINAYLRTGTKKVIGTGREVEGLTRDGHRIPMELSVTEMAIDDERYFTGVLRDISDRVKLREAMRKINEELFSANLELKNVARTDGLTGLANRRHFDFILDAEIRRAVRQGDCLSLVLMDIDHFKLYNDNYGHQQGDVCLQSVSRTLKEVFQRSGELPARYGGEEFVVILPYLDQQSANERVRILKQAIWDINLPHAKSLVADRVTMSIGVSTFCAKSSAAPSAEALIESADKALYQSKNDGRNRISLILYDVDA